MTPPGAAPNPQPSSSASTAPTPASLPHRHRRRTRRRFWLLLALTLLVSLALYPPPWHAILRTLLTWEASRRGWVLEIGSIQGGLFDATTLFDVHCHRRDAAPAAASSPSATLTNSSENPLPRVNGSDVRIARIEATLAWRIPFLQPPAASWLRRLTIDGLSGTLDFTPAPLPKGTPTPAARLFGYALPPSLDPLPWLALHCVPENFEALHVDARLQRGPVQLQTQGARLTAYRDGPGQFLAHGIHVSGPGFENTLTNLHGQTLWRAPELTFTGLSLGRSVDLTSVKLDGERLWSQRLLRWDATLTALSGTVRTQGTVNLSRERLDLDAAGSFQQVAVRPLARLLGIDGPTDGNVEQGQFSFHGDPVDWAAATISLAASAQDFRWRQRRWQNLELAAVVVNRRAEVRKLELRQSRNQLSFQGECALPLPPESADALAWLLGGGFTGNIDAKLDDLSALVQLLGPGLPEISGRMSVNGKLTPRSQGRGLDGYLNVEGSELSILGAPLDFLRSTLFLRGEEMQVADLQATRATDYFTGKGVFRIIGPPRYQAELRAAIDDLSVYHPAYASAFSPKPLAGSLRLEWSGDGGPGAHSGAFRGNVEKFLTGAGPAALARPVNVEAEGTYSPVSLSFRRFALKEGEGDKRRDALKLEGALPWKQDAALFAAGRWLDPERPMLLRAEFADAPLDLLFVALTPASNGLPAAEGLLSGNLEITGPANAPVAKGALQLKKAALHWPKDAEQPIEGLNANLRIEDSVLRVDQAQAKRGGIDWQIGGVADLHDPSNPILDATLRASRVPRAVDNDFARADADLSFNVTGPLMGWKLDGDVRLLDGTFYRQLEIIPFAETLGDDEAFLPVAQWLPREWLDRSLNLRVTSDKPLRILTQDGPSGELTPDLQLTGTGRAPTVSGKLAFAKTRLVLPGEKPSASEAALYFNAGLSDATPTLSITAAFAPVATAIFSMSAGPKTELYLYGSSARGQAVSWRGAVISGLELLPDDIEKSASEPVADWLGEVWAIPAELPPSEMWADKQIWLAAPPLETEPAGWAVRLR